jgi:hypothetical protein
MSTAPEAEPSQEAQADLELIAFHEAGHAVVMWVLGLGIRVVSIVPAHGLSGYADPEREYIAPAGADLHTRRFIAEQGVIQLHAGDVAARLFRPGVELGQAAIDHRRIHGHLASVEDDAALQITWCNYLWQRAYALLAWPPKWHLVVGLARQLLAHGTLDGKEATRYLARAAEKLTYDPGMPNCIMLGEVTYICSPWHRDWLKSSPSAHSARRAALRDSIAGLTAKADVRPIEQALTGLSPRAQRYLASLDIRIAADLEDWNIWSLGRFKGGGKKTVQEIVDAAAEAGVPLAQPGYDLPWQLNPARWRRL